MIRVVVWVLFDGGILTMTRVLCGIVGVCVVLAGVAVVVVGEGGAPQGRYDTTHTHTPFHFYTSSLLHVLNPSPPYNHCLLPCPSLSLSILACLLTVVAAPVYAC